MPDNKNIENIQFRGDKESVVIFGVRFTKYI